MISRCGAGTFCAFSNGNFKNSEVFLCPFIYLFSSMKRNLGIFDASDQGKNKRQQHDGFTSVFRNNAVEAKQHSQVLEDVYGEIKLVGSPNYCLVLDNGSRITPLIPVDSARNLALWISSVGRRVAIKQLFVISENFQILKENDCIKHENYIVKWENIRILEDEEIHPRYKDDVKYNENTKIPKTVEARNIINGQSTCKVLVHHVSSLFLVGSTATCLVFISYYGRSHVESKLWLVLRNEQVAWREFLSPKREYLFHFPQGTDKFFFDMSKKPLDLILERNIREIQVLFHHKILFSKCGTLKGSVVPSGSKLYLSQSTSFSELVYRFTADLLWFRFWFSTSEADHANVPLVTFYGKVTSVTYLEEDIYKSCYLCIHKKPRDPELKTPKDSVPQVWMDPFKSNLAREENPFKRELAYDKNVLMELPMVADNADSSMETGVPGGLVQMMKLEDLQTGEERCIYVKHSYVSSCQRMVRLAAGVCVCLSHLNRRCSGSGNYYYITTLLTCCRVLDYRDSAAQCEGWGMYGLCETTNDPQVKTWGVLEPFNLIKVAVRAKCNYCGALFFQRRCSNYCTGSGDYTSSAYAIAWINIIHDNKSITMEKVLIKDDLVRKLLCIPEKMWVMLAEAAAQEEIVAFRDKDLNELSALTHLRRSFHIYCNVKSKEKFYISVKKLPPQDDGDLYFCTNLEPINRERLNIVAELVMKATN